MELTMEEFLEEMKDECQNENECDGMYNVLEETNEKMRENVEREANEYDGTKGRHKLKKGCRSVLETHPQLFDDSDYKVKWDREMNEKEGIYPEDYSRGSRGKVWWKYTSDGHSEKAIVKNITRKINYTIDNKITAKKGVNDLKTCRIDLFNGTCNVQWDTEKNEAINIYPENYTVGSSMIAWWKCKKDGYSWDSPIYNITNRSSCPCCSSEHIVSGINDIKTTNPELFNGTYSIQWDTKKNEEEYIFPENYSRGMNKDVWWKCKDDDYSWKYRIIDITKGTKCPRCNRTKIFIGINDLKTIKPELFDGTYKIQWDTKKNEEEGIFPENYSKGSEKKVWCKCIKDGYIFQIRICDIIRGRGCLVCASKVVVEGINDLKTLVPQLFDGTYRMQWDWNENDKKGLDPTKLTTGVHKKASFICKNGHRWESSISNAAKLTKGCPFCAGKQSIIGTTDLTTTHPSIAKEWNYKRNGNKKPEQFTAGSNKKVSWTIDVEKYGKTWHLEWEDKISIRALQNAGCPFITNKKLLKGFNDFETWCKHNDMEYLLDEWDYKKNTKSPSEYLDGGGESVYWIKTLENINGEKIIATWKSPIYIRKKGHSDPFSCCPPRKVLKNYNDLATTHPDLINEWDFENNTESPYDITFASNKKVFWICPICGKSFKSSVIQRTNGQRSCPDCKSSHGEMKIKDILEKYDIVNERQYRFADCMYIHTLRFDFAIFDKNRNLKMLIEYQGEQHYKPVDFNGIGGDWADQQFELNQKRDQIKRNYCKKNHIPLIEIAYTEYDNIEEILLKEFKKFDLI